MPEISRFYGVIILMYFSDHNPPHFHARYSEYTSEIDINTLEIIKGKLPRRAKVLALEWASEHRKELLKNWELARKKKALKKIKPLD